MSLYIVKWKSKSGIAIQRDCDSEKDAAELIDILRNEGNWSAYVLFFKNKELRTRNLKLSKGALSA